MSDFLNWADLIWLPIAILVTKGALRLKAALFVLCCVGMLRLQTSLMGKIGYQDGFLHWINTPILYRGMIVYSVFIALLLGLVATSKRTNGYVFIAASITLFTIAFCISSAVMVL